ncbi:M15 family metallopeptidase [Brevifollis gellanilyticus]|uniref:D-alanyl-D-alanine dipeptidase n=1 Tax=Brevifollis gellanilyticus TaxID=748831 RepID=A0A512MD65_9BACT|nr:M15 family metallopeptidase [Brevifollis gellanilyticus]GEP44658.1 D-alanyl-D-alanine dipeptidase [Brevifollis gellanilyticus]
MFIRIFLSLSAAATLLLTGCAAGPGGWIDKKQVTAAARAKGLVDVRAAIPGIRVDLRYATRHNVTGRPLYPRNMPCLLRAATLERLKVAQAALKAQGYGVKIWDAWRPPEVQRLLVSKDGESGMFMDPETSGWSRHCGGVSLDATLVDASGHEMRMPTAFDENFAQAGSDQIPADPVVRQNLQILHSAMRAAGLKPLPAEWWHFDDIDHISHPVLVVKGEDIGILVR